MSDSWIAWKPRIEEPSNIWPFGEEVRCRRVCAGTLKCCMTPGRSQNRTSTNLTSSSLMNVEDLVSVAEHPASCVGAGSAPPGASESTILRTDFPAMTRMFPWCYGAPPWLPLRGQSFRVLDGAQRRRRHGIPAVNAPAGAGLGFPLWWIARTSARGSRARVRAHPNARTTRARASDCRAEGPGSVGRFGRRLLGALIDWTLCQFVAYAVFAPFRSERPVRTPSSRWPSSRSRTCSSWAPSATRSGTGSWGCRCAASTAGPRRPCRCWSARCCCACSSRDVLGPGQPRPARQGRRHRHRPHLTLAGPRGERSAARDDLAGCAATRRRGCRRSRASAPGEPVLASRRCRASARSSATACSGRDLLGVTDRAELRHASGPPAGVAVRRACAGRLAQLGPQVAALAADPRAHLLGQLAHRRSRSVSSARRGRPARAATSARPASVMR